MGVGSTFTKQLITIKDPGQTPIPAKAQKGTEARPVAHRAVQGGTNPFPDQQPPICLLCHACCLPGWDSGSRGQDWPATEVFLLKEKLPSLAWFESRNKRQVLFCSKWLACSPASQVRVRSPWSQLGPVPALFSSPSRCSVHTAPLFPFKSPLHQLFAWGDISGKCEEMAAEPKP